MISHEQINTIVLSCMWAIGIFLIISDLSDYLFIVLFLSSAIIASVLHVRCRY